MYGPALESNPQDAIEWIVCQHPGVCWRRENGREGVRERIPRTDLPATPVGDPDRSADVGHSDHVRLVEGLEDAAGRRIDGLYVIGKVRMVQRAIGRSRGCGRIEGHVLATAEVSGIPRNGNRSAENTAVRDVPQRLRKGIAGEQKCAAVGEAVHGVVGVDDRVQACDGADRGDAGDPIRREAIEFLRVGRHEEDSGGVGASRAKERCRGQDNTGDELLFHRRFLSTSDEVFGSTR